MKPLESIDNPNCISTPASCVEWNYGSIPFLGICNGDKLPKIIWEIVNKLEGIAGEDISKFDIDLLLEVCTKKAPQEITLISILELLRDNQICLKDYILTLEKAIADLSKSNNVNVSLNCFAQFDNFGNQLSISRDALDQLVIDILCNHETRITTTEGKVINLQNQINLLPSSPGDEPLITTCVDAGIKPVSSQVISIANEVCDIRNEYGDTADVSNARAKYSFLDGTFNSISGWLITAQRENLSDDLSNLFLVVNNLLGRLVEIETNCCAPTCDKIQIGFSVIVDILPDYLVRFRPTDGNNLFGFVNNNSKIKFSGTSPIDGSIITTAELAVDIEDETGENNSYALGTTFDTSKPITVMLTAKLIRDGLSCEKCISQIIDLNSGCPVCEVVAGGTKGGTKQLTFTYEF